MQPRPVERAVHVGQVGVGVTDPGVAPKSEVIVPGELEIEFAARRSLFLDGAVVTISGRVILGIKPSEQGLGRLVEGVAENLVQGAFTGIGAGLQAPPVCEFALGEKGKTSCKAQIIAVAVFLRGDKVGRAAVLVGGQCKIGETDGKPVLSVQGQVPKEQLAVARFIQNGHLDRMHPVRQDLLGDEFALCVHRHRVTGQPDAMILGNSCTVGPYCSSMKFDRPAGETTLPISGQQLRVRVRLGNGRIDAICHPQGLRTCLVEMPRLVVDTHDILQLADRCVDRRQFGLPAGHPRIIHGEHRQGG